MDFNTFLHTQLNEPQRAAVLHEHGPILVVAGAGSGKTRIITARIAHLLLNRCVPASAIVALTFTNKAAQEMRERIATFLPAQTPLPFIGTFHAYCLRLIKAHASLLGIDQVTILDADDQYALIKKLVDRSGQKQINARQAQYQISLRKNALNMGDAWESNRVIDDLYNAYENEKRISHCLDFDDLLLRALALFTQHPEFGIRYRTNIRHALVDEYQDTNIVQHALLKAMTLEGKNSFAIDSLCVVGDEDQSIYSWRGATVDNILSFTQTFAHTTHVTVEQNYRSVQPILTLANTLIANNTNRNPKQLWSLRTGNNRIAHVMCRSEHQEADLIAALLDTRIQRVQANNIAVLYRTHFQSRVIEEALIRRAIPYRIVGGTQFYERKEIKDILAYARLIVNPRDRIAFTRAINCPPRRLGDAFMELFLHEWSLQPFATFHDIARIIIAQKLIAPTQQTKLATLAQLIAQAPHDHAPHYILEHIVKAVNYYDYLKDEYEPKEAEARIQNVQELINAAQFFEEQGIATLESLLTEIALLQDRIHDADGSKCVQLMTLHAAKGLEFDTVIVAGLEDGILPSAKSVEQESALEEERRLLYVGITRAQNYVVLTRAQGRCVYGMTQYQLGSRFLKELALNTCCQEDCSGWRDYQLHSFAQQFFTGHGAPTPQPTLMTFSKPAHRPQEPEIDFDRPKDLTQTKQQPNESKPAFLDQLRTLVAKKQPRKLATPARPQPKPTPVVRQEHNQRWKLHQEVIHQTFGPGVIQAIEKKDNGKTYITAQFAAGIKKVDSSFLS